MIFMGMTYAQPSLSTPWFVNAYVGGQSVSTKASNFTLVGNQLEVLQPQNKQSRQFSWGLGAGYRWIFSSDGKTPWLHDISLGLDYLPVNVTRNGEILDYGILNNFNYKYKLHSHPLLVNVGLTFPGLFNRVYPLFIAGIGGANNRLSYDDTPKDTQSGQASLNMYGQSQQQLAYDLGGGLQVSLNEHIALSFRYVYINAGKAKMGQNTTLGVYTPLSISFKTQTYLFGVTYQI